MQNKTRRGVLIRGMLVIMAAFLILILAIATVAYVRHLDEKENEESSTTSVEQEEGGGGDLSGGEVYQPNGDNYTDIGELAAS